MGFLAPIGPGAGYGRSSPCDEVYRLTWKVRRPTTSEVTGTGDSP
jgi:hypothetical protein